MAGDPDRRSGSGPASGTRSMPVAAGGVVPRVGQQHLQVGRVAEVRALVGDITGSPTAGRRSGS